MTKNEFEWAWDQSPSPAVAELFLHPEAIVKIEKPMDRAWSYKGLIPGTACDWIVPCGCTRPTFVQWVAEPLAPSSRREGRAFCMGVQWYIGPKRGWIYAGKCDECGRVYWLERVRES